MAAYRDALRQAYFFSVKKFQEPRKGVVSVVNAGALLSTLGVCDRYARKLTKMATEVVSAI